MKHANLTFNFIGVSVVNWHTAFQFFHETLGLKYRLEPKHGNWAIFGSAWDAYYQEGNRSAIFELFDNGRSVSKRHWGLNQGIRPGFHVSNLQNMMRRFEFPFTVEEHPWGETAEFMATEGIRFAFAEIPNTPYSDDIASPYIGHVAIKCADFDAMQNFYGDILGFTQTDTNSNYAVFAQMDGYPSVILERGGSASTFDPGNTQWKDNAVRAFPVFLSVMTQDLQSTYEYLKTKDVKILRDIITDNDWGGIDLHIADPDGNGIQVVQYSND